MYRKKINPKTYFECAFVFIALALVSIMLENVMQCIMLCIVSVVWVICGILESRRQRKESKEYQEQFGDEKKDDDRWS